MDLNTALEFVGGRQRGVLTTMKRDGRPQLSNITYHLGDDGVVRISVTTGRAKTANLRRDPRASLHVTSDDFWQYVVIEGRADLAPTAAAPDDATVEELVTYYRAVAGEHPDWDDYREAMRRQGKSLIRIAVESWGPIATGGFPPDRAPQD
jgi:PPOX class probable F420-dependent enzyme